MLQTLRNPEEVPLFCVCSAQNRRRWDITKLRRYKDTRYAFNLLLYIIKCLLLCLYRRCWPLPLGDGGVCSGKGSIKETSGVGLPSETGPREPLLVHQHICKHIPSALLPNQLFWKGWWQWKRKDGWTLLLSACFSGGTFKQGLSEHRFVVTRFKPCSGQPVLVLDGTSRILPHPLVHMEWSCGVIK